jgi:hypothetical protein
MDSKFRAIAGGEQAVFESNRCSVHQAQRASVVVCLLANLEAAIR